MHDEDTRDYVEAASDLVFPGDSYTTPEGRGTPFASRFPFIYFYWKVGKIIRNNGLLAAKGLYRGREWCEGSLGTMRALEDCGVRFFVSGQDNIDKVDGPCIFIANHMSTLETFVLPVFVQPRKIVTFVIKDSLLRYPWFGEVLKSRDPIVVGRVNPRKDLSAVLEGGEERLVKGKSIIIFPQSTRSTTLDPETFNSIGIKLARRAKVPVIPLALRSDAWGMSGISKDFGPINSSLPVHFCFGEPFVVQGNGKAEHQAVCAFISERLAAWSLPA